MRAKNGPWQVEVFLFVYYSFLSGFVFAFALGFHFHPSIVDLVMWFDALTGRPKLASMGFLSPFSGS